MTNRILAINPGSTSTKVAVFDNADEILELTLRHNNEELAQFPHVKDQFNWREKLITDALAQAGIELSSINAVIGRGGLVRPIPSGVYQVNDALKRDLENSPIGEHASNLGGLIADELARSIGVKAYIADPVVVDELQDVARVSGSPLMPRKSIFHALNQKAIARSYANQIGRPYEELNLIVAHMGGGISVGAHRKGLVIDTGNALDGEGAFSPERAGTLPAGQLVKLCFSGEYTQEQMMRMLSGKGGMVAHLGTNDARDALKMMDEGDQNARLIVDAMCYGVGKQIGTMAAVLHGKVDAILLTGGMAYSNVICGYIREMSGFIAEVVSMPGENELQALAMNAQMVLEGKLTPRIYEPKA